MSETTESIRLMCPNLTCRKILAVPISARDKTVRCKSCGTNIRVPVPAPESKSKASSATNSEEQAKKAG